MSIGGLPSNHRWMKTGVFQVSNLVLVASLLALTLPLQLQVLVPPLVVNLLDGVLHRLFMLIIMLEKFIFMIMFLLFSS